MLYNFKYIYLFIFLILFPFFSYGEERKKIYFPLNNQIEQIKEIELILNSHGELIYQIQQELLENKKETDILRGKIQEIQHKFEKIKN